ncbi:MAG: GNAT family N-acetyltransferase [Candidatus Eisenbacteria bacterium]
MEYRVVPDLNEEESKLVRDGLDEYNARFTEPVNFSEIGLALRGESGEIHGGLIGSVHWGWLHIHVLWVSDSLRGQGHGTALLQTCERIAQDRGCRFAKLHTFDFQAPRFYASHGYKVISETNGFPEGRVQFLMFKEL